MRFALLLIVPDRTRYIHEQRSFRFSERHKTQANGTVAKRPVTKTDMKTLDHRRPTFP